VVGGCPRLARSGGLGDPATTPLEQQPGIFGSERWSLSSLLRWARMAGGEAAFGGDLLPYSELTLTAPPP
jgi:hypothetical protein